jgi:hypothetical protein
MLRPAPPNREGLRGYQKPGGVLDCRARDASHRAYRFAFKRSDMLILCTPHSEYADANLDGKPVVDVWGFLKNANVVY